MQQSKATHYRWDDLPKEKLTEFLDRRIITGNKAMLTHVYMKKGCVVPMHHHENEQLTYVLEGALKFWIGSEDAEPVVVHAGEGVDRDGKSRFEEGARERRESDGGRGDSRRGSPPEARGETHERTTVASDSRRFRRASPDAEG